jgi:hypothetical protein
MDIPIAPLVALGGALRQLRSSKEALVVCLDQIQDLLESGSRPSESDLPERIHPAVRSAFGRGADEHGSPGCPTLWSRLFGDLVSQFRMLRESSDHARALCDGRNNYWTTKATPPWTHDQLIREIFDVRRAAAPLGLEDDCIDRYCVKIVSGESVVDRERLDECMKVVDERGWHLAILAEHPPGDWRPEHSRSIEPLTSLHAAMFRVQVACGTLALDLAEAVRLRAGIRLFEDYDLPGGVDPNVAMLQESINRDRQALIGAGRDPAEARYTNPNTPRSRLMERLIRHYWEWVQAIQAARERCTSEINRWTSIADPGWRHDRLIRELRALLAVISPAGVDVDNLAEFCLKIANGKIHFDEEAWDEAVATVIERTDHLSVLCEAPPASRDLPAVVSPQDTDESRDCRASSEVVDEDSGVASRDSVGHLREQGDYWSLGYEDTQKTIEHCHGLIYLRELLANAGRPLAVSTLFCLAHPGTQEEMFRGAAEAPNLEGPAVSRCREDLEQINRELKIAQDNQDHAAQERLSRDRQTLAKELAAQGWSGRENKQTKVIRDCVRNALNRVINKLRGTSFADHLEASLVRAGNVMVYVPGETIEWEF